MTNRLMLFLLLPIFLLIGQDMAAQKNKSAQKISTVRKSTQKKKISKKINKSSSKKKDSIAKKKSIKGKTSIKKSSNENKVDYSISNNNQLNSSDTSGTRTVVITSNFKPSLQYAAKINFTAATIPQDSSKIVLSYKVPSSNLFFSYEPIAIQPLALPTDTGFVWTNHHQIKLGAGNLSTLFGEGRFSFGDGIKSTTTVHANFISSKSNVFAQQFSKLHLDAISIIHSPKSIEWTSQGTFTSATQFRYGFRPSTLAYTKDKLKQTFNTVMLSVGAKNKLSNDAGVNYHPKLLIYRFTDNLNVAENNLILQLPVEKSFGKLFSFKLAFDADIASLNTQPNVINNNLFSLNTAVVFKTPNFIVNIGLRPSWDNSKYTMLPDLLAETKLKNTPISLQLGWDGRFMKNSYRSMIAYNPWIGALNTLLNTQINQQFIGVKGHAGNHISYNARLAFQQLKNQPLFLNDVLDGKSFVTSFESSMNALKIQGEFGYTVQDNLSFLASGSFTQFNAFSMNSNAWGLIPVEISGSMLWKPQKDLQIKADLFYLGGSMYKTLTNLATRLSPGLDFNMGGEFAVHNNWKIWLQMNNLFNNTYQRWNQYPVFGFNVMAGVVYSFQ